MNNENRIPLVIGVTGHRDLVTEDLSQLKAAVTSELQKLQALCPDSPVVLLSSLAEGADQLCARAALEAGWEISAVLPLPLEEYEKDFSGDVLTELRSLLAACRDVFVVSDPEGDRSEQNLEAISGLRSHRDCMYLQAGMYVTDHCHVLLALWDGAPGKPTGCGTAETADYAIHHKTPVLQIVTRRRSQMDANGEACTAVWNGSRDALLDILRSTNSFNKDVKAFVAHDLVAANSNPTVADSSKASSDSVSRRNGAVYTAADLLSVKNAEKHRRTIASLSIAATLLTLAFLLYDEAFLYWMILLCLFLLGSLLFISKISKRLGSHRRYLDYRILAESLRVQGYLHKAGLKTEVAEILPWSVRQDLPWIRRALAVLAIGRTPDQPTSIRSIWIQDQKTYHEKALKRTKVKARHNDRIVLVALICMVLTYLITAIFEAVWGGLFSGKPGIPPEQLELWRSILKILMGTLSAATLFAGNYYGSLSLEETAADHRRMIELYAQADEKILTQGEAPNLLIELAKEELGENSRWFAYQSMNKPGVAL